MRKHMNRRKTRQWKRSDDWSIDSQWEGTAMMYAASGIRSFALSGDYQISFDDESELGDLRAARLYRASKGDPVAEVPNDKLADELVVIFGAKMTASKALFTLKALIARIEDDGLILGRVGSGNFVHETVERELTVDDARSFDFSE
jgi:hypothetical protein